MKRINEDDIKIETIYPVDKIPVIRFTHIPSNSYVEYRIKDSKPILLKENALKIFSEML